MEMFSKLSGLLLNALETGEPTVDLLESFVQHWKSITNYYIQTTDDNRPASQTDIPWRLRQMSDILVYEEKQQEEENAAPCLEFLLQHKVLETLCTLAKAQYPPGMPQQVLLFFSRLLSQMQNRLLLLVPVYRPVQKLIGLCGLPGSSAEKEEAQFLLAVCTRASADPHVLRCVLQLVDQQPASSQSQHSAQASSHNRETPSSQSEPPAPSTVQSEQGMLWVLLQLSQSQKLAVRLKACDCLLRLSRLLDDPAAAAQIGALLAGKLQHLYSLLPLEELEAAEVRSWPRPSWRSESQPDHVTRFLAWLDFLHHLIGESPQVLSVQVCERVSQVWLIQTLHPQLLSTCERIIVVSTSVLCVALRLVQAPPLLDQILVFLLQTPSLMELLLQRCNHTSDQVSMASLSLVEELLQKPHRDILDALVLSFLQSRSYLSSPEGGAEEQRPESSGDEDDAQDLEDDPFFSDGFPDDHLPHHHRSWGAADIINSFLGLVPLQVRSAHLLQDGGHESYVLDARALVKQCQALSLPWDWPQSLPPPTGSSGREADFFEGHLLRVLFDRLGRILQQPYELNLLLTAVLSRLCAFNHPLLDEYLLDPYAHLAPGSRSLFSVLVRVVGQLVQRIQQVSALSDRLLETRTCLLGLSQCARQDDQVLLEGTVVLEEFCKELAAVAFVKMNRNQQDFLSGAEPPGLHLTGSDSVTSD